MATHLRKPEKSIATKMVQSVVRMVPECRNVLNQICQINQIKVSDYLYDVARLEIHRQAVVCPMASGLLRMYNKNIDQRVYKSCSGFHCQYCAHKDACAAGETDELFVMSDKATKALENAGYNPKVEWEEKTVLVPVIKLET
tara:strand:- start:22920 stop:23345 length:426 start_codon:yes stop_codon:yes gene_type:complete